MKTKLLFIVFAFISISCFSQEYTKFRIDEKQKKELLKNGDSYITMIETYLNNNEKSLTSKNPSLSNPTNYIDAAKKNAPTNSKLYKDICLDCYIAEYKNQLQRLENHGLTDTKGFQVTVMPLFFNQDSTSIQKLYEQILSEAKNKYSFYEVRNTNSGCTFLFFDESTKGTNNPRYLYFDTKKYNTGNNDLEIIGDNKYDFSLCYGNFLDFAGFWIKYINPNITVEKLAEKGMDEYTYKLNGETKTITLKKDSSRKVDSWYIRNW